MNICGVIFDLDGVITDSERYAKIAMQKTFEAEGFTWDEDFYLSLLGVNHTLGNQLALAKFKDEKLTDYVMNRFHQTLYTGFKNHEVKFKRGAIELIKYLNAHDFPICLATSSDMEKVRLSFHSNGEEVPFKHIVTGNMVTKSKPDPDAFYKAASILALKPEECMVIEDSYNGMEAAINGGFIATMVPDTQQPTDYILKNATFIKKDLTEVQSLLKQYVNP